MQTDTTPADVRELEIDRFVFDWFNERQPDEMRRCLDAYDDTHRAHMEADHESE